MTIFRAYNQVRTDMLPGDVIAFGGTSALSDGIKFFSGKRIGKPSTVSHVATVYHAQQRAEDGTDGKLGTRYFNNIIEATQFGDSLGVVQVQLSRRLAQYDGDVWWLPLTPEARARFNEAAFSKWCFLHRSRQYDVPQAWRAGFDLLDRYGIGLNQEDFTKLFCSELVAGALREAGVLFKSCLELESQRSNGLQVPPTNALICANASEELPIQLCERPCFDAANAVQLKGEPKGIE